MEQSQTRSKSPAARILSLALALCMIAAFVPAITLTVGAASTTTYISSLYPKAVVEWYLPDGTYDNTAISTISGWSSSVSSGYVNLAEGDYGDKIQIYGGSPNLSVSTPGYGDGSEKIILEWVFSHSSGYWSFYHNWVFYDIDGTVIDNIWIDVNYTSPIADNPIGYPDSGSDIMMVAYNNSDESTHTVEWYVNGSLTYTSSEESGTINGFGSFAVPSGGMYNSSDNWWWNMAMGGLTIAAEYSASNTTTVQAALDSLSVPYGTRENISLPSTATDVLEETVNVTWSSSNEDVLSSAGVYTDPDVVTEVTLTATANYDDTDLTSTYTVTVFPQSRAGTTWDSSYGVYVIGTENILESEAAASEVAGSVAPSFEQDGAFSLSGWTSHTGSATNTAVYNISSADEAVPEGDYAFVSMWSDSITGTNYCTIEQFIPVSAGANYLSFYTKKYSSSVSPSVYVYFSESPSHSYTAPSGEDQQQTVTPTTEWEKMEYIFTSESDGYIVFVAYQLSNGNNGGYGTYFDDFEVYTATLDEDKSFSVTRNYYLTEADKENGNIHKTVTNTASTGSTITFDPYYYSPDGSNTLYYDEDATVYESAATSDIVLTLADNNGIYTKGSNVGVDGVKYSIDSDNLIPNGDFTYGLNGWYLGTGADATTSTAFTVNTDGTISCSGSDGRGSQYSIVRSWEIEDGETYLFTYSDDMYGNHDNSQYHIVLASNDMTNADTGTVLHNSSQGDGAFVFTNDSNYDYVKINFRWIYYYPFGNFGLYKVTDCGEEALESINTISDVNVISGNDPVLPTTVTGTGDLGSTMTASVTWATDGLDFTNTDSTVNTVTVPGTVDGYSETVYVTVNVYPVSFTMDTITSQNTQSGYYESFPYDVTGDAKIEFTLYYNTLIDNEVIGINSVSAISEKGTLWGGQQIQMGGNASSQFTAVNGNGSGTNNGTVTIDLSAQTNYRVFLETNVSDHTYSLTITDESTGTLMGTITDNGYRYNADKLDAFYLFTNGGGSSGDMVVSNLKVYDPDIVFVDYTVKYVDTNGNALDTSLNTDGDATGTYSTTEAKTKAYAGNITCPYVPIPYFEGYVFTDKSVSGTEITLTYTAVDTSKDFFTNVENDTTYVSLNMLGAHDAFTSSVSSMRDAAAIARGESGASLAYSYPDLTKTQSKTAYELLDYGVRYFDIRLSRSDTDTIDSNYTTYGVFYTTHNSLSDEFRSVAYTIGQWAKQHPGEVLILDFQEVWDATADGDQTTDDDGEYTNAYGNTAATWQDVYSILEEAGITDFVRTGSQSMKTVTYGDLTLDKTEAGIVLFGRANADGVGKFNYRGNTSSLFAGRLYSNYNVPGDGEFEASYIQTQVDALKNYQSVDGDQTGDNPVNFMTRVMQAQTEYTMDSLTSVLKYYDENLLETAATNNSALLTAITQSDYSEWLTALPIVMVNGVGSNTNGILAILQSCNEAQNATINYTYNDGTVKSDTREVMVGTIFTENQYTFVNGTDAEYYVLNNYSTSPYYCTYGDTYTSTGGSSEYELHNVVYVPYSGSSTWTYEVPVTILGNVYTAAVNDFTASGTTYYENTVYYGNLVDSGDYNGLTDFGAMSWESTNGSDRVGVAILDKPDADPTADYYLTATFARNTGSATVNLYAIDYTIFKSITSLAELKDYFIVDNYVGDASQDTTGVVALDEDVIDAISTDKVVILGAANGGLYGLAGSDMAITAETKDLGIDLVDGAQIRVGDGVTEEELVGDSGLRFIATVSLEDTLASIVDQNSGSEGYVIGIAIYDGGYNESITISEYANKDIDPVMQIPMTTAQQNADGTDSNIYTVAITNIDVTNYNRIYIAVPYVTVNGNTYYDYDEAVARTPYEVAAGILVNQNSSVTDGDTTYVYASSDLLTEALNVYVNKTGARINLTRSYDEETSGYIYTAGSITYSDGAEVFFTLTATNTDGNYVITLTPRGDAEFYSTHAVSRFRINNATATSFATATGGTVTLDDATGNLIITIEGTGTEITECQAFLKMS